MRARNVKKVPFVWFWPDGAPSCAIVTHDVETSSGVEFCPRLMDLNDSFGIKASFVNVSGSWRIEGRGSERARIAYAVLVNDTLAYEIDRASA